LFLAVILYKLTENRWSSPVLENRSRIVGNDSRYNH